MKIVDLRSDTITKPTLAMRAVMASAEVGDDVYLEDPTIAALEAKVAELTGKEAALFVSSGTLGNLIPIYVMAPKGTEVVMHAQAHTYRYEQSGISAVCGAKPLIINGERGFFTAAELNAVVSKAVPYYTERTSMVVIENTHNFCGGTVWPLHQLADVASAAASHGLPLHLDGARLFNAACASKTTVAELAKGTTSLTLCLSKGLGAPIGAMIAGDKAFIYECRRVRKMLGGGMRQAGIVAAAGIYALDHHVERLQDDHDHAKMLAAALNKSGVATVTEEPQTNIVFATTTVPAADLVKKLAAHSVRGMAMGSNTVRLVTHLDVDTSDIEHACQVIKTLA